MRERDVEGAEIGILARHLSRPSSFSPSSLSVFSLPLFLSLSLPSFQAILALARPAAARTTPTATLPRPPTATEGGLKVGTFFCPFAFSRFFFVSLFVFLLLLRFLLLLLRAPERSFFFPSLPPTSQKTKPSAYGPGAYPGAVPAAPGKPGAPGAAAAAMMPPPAPGGGFGGAGFDLEAQQAANFAAGFAEQQVRSRFVGKVLSIVFLQLLCTVGMSVLFFYVMPLKLYVRQNAWPFYLSWALSFGMLIAMSCSESLRRKYPTNVLFLGAFTAVFSFQIAAVTSYFNTQAVMIAFIATTAVVLGCASIAFFTKLDMTKYGGWLAIAGLSFMVVALIAAFWPWGGETERRRRRRREREEK